MPTNDGCKSEDGAKNVLIVDDDPLVIKAMDLLMSKAGFRPIVCANGTDALHHAKRELAAAIIDIHLPDINGLELSQQLRDRIGPTTPIIILSGDNSMEIIRALPKTGANYFFSKPVNATALIERLKEWATGR